MKAKPTIVLMLLAISISCDKEQITISKDASEFLNEVLDVMEYGSINRKVIDWKDFRSQVLREAGAAQSIDETYNAIKLALTLLGDNHSSFTKPDGTRFWGNYNTSCQSPPIGSEVIPEDIGYVRVGKFQGTDQNEMLAFAESLQNIIRNEEDKGIIGWIVDLRGNGGGNIWPMLAGIGPILGDGIAGYNIGPDNYTSLWGYEKGLAHYNYSPQLKLSNPYELINPNPRVALLLNNNVASSGEAIAVSFVGRANTKSFGKATCGLSTNNRTYDLSNGSKSLLTIADMADRNKNVYGGPIEPDMELDNELIIDAAVDFIRN